MSRQNKVNPGMYTQRGRLTQDDAARELRKQSATGSPHTWQPVNTRTSPRLAPAGEAPRTTDQSADKEAVADTPAQSKTRPASRVNRRVTSTQPAASDVRAKAAKAKPVKTSKSMKTTATAKARKATKQGTPMRKAMLARSVGGRRPAARPTAKRPKR